MLSLRGCPPPPPQPPPPLRHTSTPHKPISQFLPFPSKTHQTQLAFPSNGPTRHTSSPLLPHKFCVSALHSRRNGGSSLLETSGFDDDDDEEEEFDDDDEDEDEDEEELIIPLRNMRQWMENRPRGFGEGKVYDTSLEDNLLEEIEQSREAQLANLNKLNNNPDNSISNSNSKKGILHQQKAPEDVPSGIRVRLGNLPKKKNIHKDLQVALKGVPGIVNIVPAVSGNKKTRDPICKGFAFIDLKSEEDANRFVQIVSRQSISFGKIQKQVRCEIVNSKSPSSVQQLSADGNYGAPRVAILSLRESPDADIDKIVNTSSDSRELIASDKSEGEDDEQVPAQWEEEGENLGSFSLSELSVGDSLGTITESASDTISSKQKKKVRANEKKMEDKRKRTKVPKLAIPGSANRLRIKEKAVLTGVLSKYAVPAASASNEKP